MKRIHKLKLTRKLGKFMDKRIKREETTSEGAKGEQRSDIWAVRRRYIRTEGVQQ